MEFNALEPILDINGQSILVDNKEKLTFRTVAVRTLTLEVTKKWTAVKCLDVAEKINKQDRFELDKSDADILAQIIEEGSYFVPVIKARCIRILQEGKKPESK